MKIFNQDAELKLKELRTSNPLIIQDKTVKVTPELPLVKMDGNEFLLSIGHTFRLISETPFEITSDGVKNYMSESYISEETDEVDKVFKTPTNGTTINAVVKGERWLFSYQEGEWQCEIKSS